MSPDSIGLSGLVEAFDRRAKKAGSGFKKVYGMSVPSHWRSLLKRVSVAPASDSI